MNDEKFFYFICLFTIICAVIVMLFDIVQAFSFFSLSDIPFYDSIINILNILILLKNKGI